MDSWEVFVLAHTRTRFRDEQNRDVEVFDCRWDFVQAFLAHAELEDAEQVLRDLMELVRGLNQ